MPIVLSLCYIIISNYYKTITFTRKNLNKNQLCSIMKKKLEDYFNTYIQEIRNSDNTELRNFFILAMNYSCNVIEKI